MEKHAIIQTTGIAYRYPESDKLLKFPDVACQAGHSVLITGPSGCGKTTWLHLIAGLLNCTEGKIVIDNRSMAALSRKGRDAFRSKNIGLVFQKTHFIESLNVWDNLCLFQKLSLGKTETEVLNELLDSLSLTQHATRYPGSLSQGEAQRLSVARALVHKPKVLLADEPTASLDDLRTERTIQLLLQQAKKYQAALIVVSHDTRLRTLLDRNIALS